MASAAHVAPAISLTGLEKRLTDYWSVKVGCKRPTSYGAHLVPTEKKVANATSPVGGLSAAIQAFREGIAPPAASPYEESEEEKNKKAGAHLQQFYKFRQVLPDMDERHLKMSDLKRRVDSDTDEQRKRTAKLFGIPIGQGIDVDFVDVPLTPPDDSVERAAKARKDAIRNASTREINKLSRMPVLDLSHPSSGDVDN